MYTYQTVKVFPDIPPEVAVVIMGAMFAILAMYFVWRLGILDAPRYDKCWMCATPAAPGANYCSHCGKKLHRCRKCGRVNKPENLFCPSCGQNLQP